MRLRLSDERLGHVVVLGGGHNCRWIVCLFVICARIICETEIENNRQLSTPRTLRRMLGCYPISVAVLRSHDTCGTTARYLTAPRSAVGVFASSTRRVLLLLFTLRGRARSIVCDIVISVAQQAPPTLLPLRMKAGFRNTQWDPVILVSQIVAMQSLLYVSLGALLFVMDWLAGANHTLDHIFQYHVRARRRARKCVIASTCGEML